MKYNVHYFYNKGYECGESNAMFNSKKEMTLDDIREEIIAADEVDSVVIRNCRVLTNNEWESMFVNA